MNYKAGFDRLSIVLAVLSAPIIFWLIAEGRAPKYGEVKLSLVLLIGIGVAVWFATRVILWVVRGFLEPTQPHREPPA